MPQLTKIYKRISPFTNIQRQMMRWRIEVLDSEQVANCLNQSNGCLAIVYFRSVDDLIGEWNIGLLETYIINFLKEIEPKDETTPTPIAVESSGRSNFLIVVDREDRAKKYYLSEMISK